MARREQPEDAPARGAIIAQGSQGARTVIRGRLQGYLQVKAVSGGDMKVTSQKLREG